MLLQLEKENQTSQIDKHTKILHKKSAHVANTMQAVA